MWQPRKEGANRLEVSLRMLPLLILLNLAWVRGWTVRQKSLRRTALPTGDVPHSQQRRTRSTLRWSKSRGTGPGVSHDDDGGTDRGHRHDLRLLLLDHYDSFTYNLVDLLAQLCTHPPRVVAADAAESWSELVHNVLRVSTSSSRDDDDGRYDLDYDGIVLGPGPGSPEDYSLSLDVLRNAQVPILGVCLGHQMMGLVHGAKVALAPTEIHGQVWPVQLHPTVWNSESAAPPSLFDHLPARIPATRYHSLHVTWDVEDTHSDRDRIPLRMTANTDDGVCMALQHVTLPHYGVQFHPESIGSQPHGKQLLDNFCRIATHRRRSQRLLQPQQIRHHTHSWNGRTLTASNQTTESDSVQDPEVRIQSNAPKHSSSLQARSGHHDGSRQTAEESSGMRNYTVLMHKVPSSSLASPEQVMQSFLAHEPYSFWLDSSNYYQSQQQHSMSQSNNNENNNRISILGASTSRGGRRIEYYGHDHPESKRGVYVHHPDTRRDKAPVERLPIDILSHLAQEQRSTSFNTVVVHDEEGNSQHSATTQKAPSDENSILDTLPFDFCGGYVGYLGYEVRFDTERFLQQEELGRPHNASYTPRTGGIAGSSRRVPTAAFVWADRSFVYDHQTNDWYLLGVVPCDNADDHLHALAWMRESARRLRDSTVWIQPEHSHGIPSPIPPQESLTFVPKRSRRTYNRNFQTCLEHIRAGDSYELCLTNRFDARVDNASSKSLLSLYRLLRRRNPAPFSAFFHWNSQSTTTKNIRKAPFPSDTSFAIACSSPERFVSVKQHRNHNIKVPTLQVEAKPIKGTAARVLPANGQIRTPLEAARDAQKAQALQESVKDRAENLMIVDLLRNDLSRVCETGSVHVAKLFGIESFATVHQMVSTIRGTLQRHQTSIDVLKACFPGGSMTGAPKLRTTELLAEIENFESRGPYSGCLGYISLNGAMDMNIIIRSAILTRDVPEQNEWLVRIGAGGAITALSESDDEYGEMMLKASAVMSSVSEWARGGSDRGIVAAVQGQEDLVASQVTTNAVGFQRTYALHTNTTLR